MKEKCKKILACLLIFVCVFGSISLATTDTVHAATKLTATKTSVKLEKKKSTTLSFKLNGKKIANSKLNFKSSNPKVATVDKKGKVKAIKSGTTKITATLKSNKKVKKVVTVKVTGTTPEDKPGNGGNSSSNAPSFTGGNISLDNIGISVPTLNKFNNAGLKESDDGSWFGGSSNHDTMQELFDNANAVMGATGYGVSGSDGNGFTITEYYIEWAYAGYSAVNDISLHRDTTNGYYVLEINTPLDTDIYGTRDIAPISRDIVKFMLSCVTSNVQTVYSSIYQDIYGDVCISDSGWTTLGDCKVQFDYNSSYQGHFVYKIKAK